MLSLLERARAGDEGARNDLLLKESHGVGRNQGLPVASTKGGRLDTFRPQRGSPRRCGRSEASVGHACCIWRCAGRRPVRFSSSRGMPFDDDAALHAPEAGGVVPAANRPSALRTLANFPQERVFGRLRTEIHVGAKRFVEIRTV
jgi:hypothetical protein